MTKILACMLICMGSVAAAQTLDDVVRDARAVRDVAHFNFNEVPAQGELWVLAEITPKVPGGQMTAEGPYIETETGKLVVPPGGRFITWVEGTVRTIAPLSSDAQGWTSDYKWEFQERSRNPEDRAAYSPFRSGGTAILHVREAAQGAEKFSRVVLIPVGWESFVVPALHYYREHLHGRPSATGPVGREQVMRVLNDENPLIAASAFRTAGLDRAAMRDRLQTASGSAQALFTFLSLTEATPEMQSALQADLNTFATEAVARADKVSGIAVAALAMLGEPDAPATRQRALDTLRMMDRTLIRADTPAVRYVDAVLTAAGLHEAPHETREKQ